MQIIVPAYAINPRTINVDTCGPKVELGDKTLQLLDRIRTELTRNGDYFALIVSTTIFDEAGRSHTLGGAMGQILSEFSTRTIYETVEGKGSSSVSAAIDTYCAKQKCGNVLLFGARFFIEEVGKKVAKAVPLKKTHMPELGQY